MQEPIFGCRGDTKLKECKNRGYNCRIDLRTTTKSLKYIDLSAAKYANKPGTFKYYKHKLRPVLSGLINLKKYTSISELKLVPSMLVEGHKGEAFILFPFDNNWLALQKSVDVDVPASTDSIKKENIKTYINSLDIFKDYCLNVKSKMNSKKKKSITKTKKQSNHNDFITFGSTSFLQYLFLPLISYGLF
ncbi:hypothetical protein RMATCC62417_13612 [Rhizopus microsporus]|nr:hypothetical protein RMATCC62417_13612 [Rhizopus microsporus]